MYLLWWSCMVELPLYPCLPWWDHPDEWNKFWKCFRFIGSYIIFRNCLLTSLSHVLVNLNDAEWCYKQVEGEILWKSCRTLSFLIILKHFQNLLWMLINLGNATKILKVVELFFFFSFAFLGKTFAAVGSMESVNGIIVHLMYNSLYPFTLSIWPGLLLALGAAFHSIPMGLIV